MAIVIKIDECLEKNFILEIWSRELKEQAVWEYLERVASSYQIVKRLEFL